MKIDPASASNFDPLKLQILALFFHTVTLISSFYNIAIVTNSIVNSGEFGDVVTSRRLPTITN
ncbi:hypothetical protein [Candidatus Tisiphia endosymbiont of Sialis lutaria]|uniref:hypothetical protein n=1 Tax=Candidatus Tisiphia endosymbiont of Sialis lutaria TaxID=2029164 RepID=UPI00312CA757